LGAADNQILYNVEVIVGQEYFRTNFESRAGVHHPPVLVGYFRRHQTQSHPGGIGKSAPLLRNGAIASPPARAARPAWATYPRLDDRSLLEDGAAEDRPAAEGGVKGIERYRSHEQDSRQANARIPGGHLGR